MPKPKKEAAENVAIEVELPVEEVSTGSRLNSDLQEIQDSLK